MNKTLFLVRFILFLLVSERLFGLHFYSVHYNTFKVLNKIDQLDKFTIMHFVNKKVRAPLCAKLVFQCSPGMAERGGGKGAQAPLILADQGGRLCPINYYSPAPPPIIRPFPVFPMLSYRLNNVITGSEQQAFALNRVYGIAKHCKGWQNVLRIFILCRTKMCKPKWSVGS